MKFIQFNLLPFFLLLLISTSTTTAEEKTELTSPWGGEWLPFWEMGADSTPTGFDIDIMKAVVKEAGFTLNFTLVEMPWKRQLYSIENGVIDIIVSATRKKEREQYAYFLGPYRQETVALYARIGESGNYSIDKIEDLLKYSNIRIGANQGVVYGDRIDSVLFQLGTKVQRVADYKKKNRLKLKAKRVDFFLGYPLVEELVKDSAIEQHPMPPVIVDDIYMMVSKKSCSPEVFDALKVSFDTIKANGVYDSIVDFYSKKYGIEKW
jgi:ABC-type amino acid transport substrate-binding protein